jgi:uncharacterized protein YndB with AHSA1/START domain
MSATVTVERRFDARPEQIFDAWLDPEAVGKWLFATPGGVMEKVDIDARVGGGFTIVERRGEEVAEHFGSYVELDRPRRLAFDFWTSEEEERTRVTVTIEADGEGSLVTLIHQGVWAEWEAQTRQGWAMILEGLARTLAD